MPAFTIQGFEAPVSGNGPLDGDEVDGVGFCGRRPPVELSFSRAINGSVDSAWLLSTDLAGPGVLTIW